MARLKIFQGNNPAGNIPDQQGYRNVATGFLADLSNFRTASTKDRADLLQQYADAGQAPQTHTIFELLRNPPVGQLPDLPINNTNCKVYINNDIRRKTGVAFGKHNLGLPEIQAPDPPLTVGYLAPYVQAIVALYGATGGGTPAQVTAACEFLFGIMLLTRCR